MLELKKVRILTLAKIQTILAAYLGFFMGILYSFGGLVIDALVSLGWISTPETSGLSVGTILAFGALSGMPIIFAAFGFVLGVVEAVLFNFFSRWFGGISVDLGQ